MATPESPSAETRHANRKVGVELEFGGLDLPVILQRVQDAVGGRIEQKSAYEGAVVGTSVGDVRAELDASLFRNFKLRGLLRNLALDQIEGSLEERVERAMATEARRFVPFEVVFEPIPFSLIGDLEAVRESLRRGAEGTGVSVFNAFGLHFNPDLPDIGPESLLRYLRAFLCRYPSLLKRHDVDTTRRISPFIDPFPRDYASAVLQTEYTPDSAALIDDYIAANPTRNRPLDLLPALAWLDEERVRHHLPDEKIGRRPALHYRLPDCRIDDPDWRISHEWRHWLAIEDLAASPSNLHHAARGARRRLRAPLRHRLREWVSRLFKR